LQLSQKNISKEPGNDFHCQARKERDAISSASAQNGRWQIPLPYAVLDALYHGLWVRDTQLFPHFLFDLVSPGDDFLRRQEVGEDICLVFPGASFVEAPGER
jgi:hypothetical protein